jgi:GDP-L-fucose synthase
MLMGQTYRQQYGLKNTCFILANLYGMYDNFDPEKSHVVPALIKKFLDAKEQNIPVVKCWGTGKGATRDLLFCQDAANALTKAVIDQFDHDKPINLGTGKDISIYDLAHLIKKIIGYQGDIVFDGSVSDGQPKRLLDVSRAKALLGWQAEADLETGLRATIEWYRSTK